MKTMRYASIGLGAVLACSILAVATSAQGKKPPKPPPEPPPAAPYDLVQVGDPGTDSDAVDINENGLILGGAYSAEGYYRPVLVAPGQENGAPVWRTDADGDGCNDLLVDLGTPPEAEPYAYPTAINDHHVILGSGNSPIPGTERSPRFAWVLPPHAIDGALTWTDQDADGFNGLMAPVPVVAPWDPDLNVMPQDINNFGEIALVVDYFRQILDADGNLIGFDMWQRGFLLLPSQYEIAADGAVSIAYPEADGDGDRLNDYLVDLGMGTRLSNGDVRPLLPTVINDQGDVAGMVWIGAGGDVNGERPFVLRPRVDAALGLVWNEDNDGDGLNDRVLYLPMPEGARSSHIYDMNENGTVVGSVYENRTGSRAILWQVNWGARTATFTELGPLDRQYDQSQALAVNDAGQVVGRSLRYMKFPTVYQRAWLWEGDGMVALNDLVPPETGLPDASSIALGINNSGLIIGSMQWEYPGPWTAFIAVPDAGE